MRPRIRIYAFAAVLLLASLGGPAAAATPSCQVSSLVTAGDTNTVGGLAAHPDGGWVTAYTHTWLSDHLYVEVTVERYAPDGALQWTWGAGGSQAQLEVASLAVLSDGAAVLGGQRWDNASPAGHFLYRVDPDGAGAESWMVGPPYGNTSIGALGAMPDDGVVATYRNSYTSELQRYGPDGDLLWTYAGEAGLAGSWGGVDVQDLAVVNGEPVMTGLYPFGGVFVARLTADGAPLWEVDLSVAGFDVARDIASHGEALVLLAKGDTGSSLVWLGADGTIAGTPALATAALGLPSSVAFHQDGGLSVAGTVAGPGGQPQDGVLARLDPAGDVLWTETFGTQLFHEGFTHHAVLTGGRMVAAGPYESAADVAFWTILAADTCDDTPPFIGACSPSEKGDCSALTDACHVGVCDPSTGGCVAHPLPAATLCDDGDACTEADICGPSGACSGLPKSCDDADPCTWDACDVTSGCVWTANTTLATCPDPCTEWSHDTSLSAPLAAFDDVLVLPGGDVVGLASLLDNDWQFSAVAVYDHAGATQYSESWGGAWWAEGTSPEAAVASALLPGGAFVVASQHDYPPAPTLRTLDAGGDLLWEASEPVGLGTTVADVASAGDGGVVMAGSYGPYARVRKHLASGAPAWDWASALSFGGGLAYATAIAARPGGGHVVVGMGQGFQTSKGWLVLLDDDGAETLSVDLEGIQPFSSVVDVAALGDRLVVLGVPKGPGGRATLLLLSSAGIPLWRRHYGGGDVSLGPRSVQVGAGGRVSVVGSHRVGAGDEDGWYLMVGAHGERLLEEVMGEPGLDDWFNAHARGQDGAVVLAGERADPASAFKGTAWIVQRCDL